MIDIIEHMPLLEEYAGKCDRVVELGVRDGSGSTTAFLKGVVGELVSYDIEILSNKHLGKLESIARQRGIKFRFIMTDVLDIEIPECDMLFIDTLHTYNQLSQELVLHGNKARKWLVFHDTWTFPDLNIAIMQFMVVNRHWRIKEIYINNNGLTILERI
jgi:hypothetical protein